MPFLEEYTSLAKIGEGGFADVFKVRHNQLGYIRAVRVLSKTIESARSPIYEKFIEECKILLRLGNGNHPNIVHIYKPDFRDYKAFVEMDYIDGQNINQYVESNDGFVEIDEVMRFAKEISSALAYCHNDIYEYCMDAELDNLAIDPNDGSHYLIDDAKRKELINKYHVIHNDMHSGNVMRRRNGSYILLDFGLSITNDTVVASSRLFNGAPEYKAPEKLNNDKIITEQTDIYGFGIILYKMLAGVVPFPAAKDFSTNVSSQNALWNAHENTPPPPILPLRKKAYEKSHNGEYKKDYPAWLEEMIMKCLAKKPQNRYRDAKVFFDTLMNHYNEYQNCSSSSPQELAELLTNKEKLQKDLNNANHKIEEQNKSIAEFREERDSICQKLDNAKEEIKALKAALRIYVSKKK